MHHHIPPVRQGMQQRPLAVYKYNMLAHVGAVSSFAVRPERARWPGCYEPMTEVCIPTFFLVFYIQTMRQR